MALPIPDVVGILADNLDRRASVFPIPRRSVVRWADGLNLPRGGETVLYTGQMYQLIPYIESMVAAEERLAHSWLARLTKLGRWVNRTVNVAGILARPSARDLALYDRVPRNVAVLLKQAGVSFGVLYDDDLYSGALAYDLGLDEVFARHAARVAQVFKRYGIRRVITLDPHTTHVLRTIYPQVVPDFDVTVQHYLEVLEERAPAPYRRMAGAVAIHDSCVLARHEGVTEAPRALLRRIGLQVREPEHHGRQTWCCGGPAESLFPERARAQAERRVGELEAAGPVGVTMCPICFVNLSKAAGDRLRLSDISEVLVAAYEQGAEAAAEQVAVPT